MEHTQVAERSEYLYTITLPPDMVMCVNAAGAMRLLNRSRVSLWNYVNAGKLRSFNISGNVAFPLVDIADMLGTTEQQVYNISLAWKLPIWQIHVE